MWTVITVRFTWGWLISGEHGWSGARSEDHEAWLRRGNHFSRLCTETRNNIQFSWRLRMFGKIFQHYIVQHGHFTGMFEHQNNCDKIIYSLICMFLSSLWNLKHSGSDDYELSIGWSLYFPSKILGWIHNNILHILLSMTFNDFQGSVFWRSYSSSSQTW